MKILNIFFILLFTISACLQLNDTDPVYWVTIYLAGAAFCVAALFRIYPVPLYIIAGAFYLSYAIFLFVTEDGVFSWLTHHEVENIVQSMKAEKPWIERTREFFGLLLLLTALAVNYFWRSRSREIPEGASVKHGE